MLTDHKPLTIILGPKAGIPLLAAARLQSWALLLSYYQYQIQYKSTQTHSSADGLSRLPVKTDQSSDSESMPTIFNIHQIVALPVTSKQIAAVIAVIQFSLVLYDVLRMAGPQQIPMLHRFHFRHEDMSCPWNKVAYYREFVLSFLPVYKPQILEELHHTHSGILRMMPEATCGGHISTKIWRNWPSLVFSASHAGTCVLQHLSIPGYGLVSLGSTIHVDYAGPIDGKMMLVVINSHSKWPEVISMSSSTTQATIERLRRLFAVYGLPQQLVSDNGPQFTSAEFAVCLRKNGVKPIHNLIW